MKKNQLCILLLFISISLPAKADEVRFLLGFAQTHSTIAFIPAGQDGQTLISPKNDKHQLVLAINGYTEISPNFKLGIGTEFTSGQLPFDQSYGIWSIDILKLEYQLIAKTWLTLSAGASKQYQSKPAYGKSYGYGLAYQLSKQIKLGLSVRSGDADQEQNDGTTDYIGGNYESVRLYLSLPL